MLGKISYAQLCDTYEWVGGLPPMSLDPVVYVDNEFNVLALMIPSNDGDFLHPVEANQKLRLFEEIDYWSGLSEDVDVNIHSSKDDYVAVSFYPVVNGETNTSISKLEGISCFVEILKKLDDEQ